MNARANCYTNAAGEGGERVLGDYLSKERHMHKVLHFVNKCTKCYVFECVK